MQAGNRRGGTPRFQIKRPLLKRISVTFHIYRRFLLFFTFFILSALSLVLNYSNTFFASSARQFLYELTLPVARLANVPYEVAIETKAWLERWALAFQKVRTLESERAMLLKELYSYKKAMAENKELRKLLNLRAAQDRPLLTARVLAYPGRPYVKSILIGAGSSSGVRARMAVMQQMGIVGRTLDIAPHSSRVLLITDLNSKIPVVIKPSGEQAILAGDNTAYPILKYVQSPYKIKKGDRVETSGQGGIFKVGMPVGAVISVTTNSIKVRPYVGLEALKHVVVMSSGLDPQLDAIS